MRTLWSPLQLNPKSLILDKTNFLYYCDTSYTQHFILKTFHQKWQQLLLKYLLQGPVNFLIWNGSDLSVSKKILKHDVLLLSTMCRNFSSKWFVLLFFMQLWIIHTKWQRLNHDLKTYSLISAFFQNSCKVILSREHLLFDLLF